MIILPPYDYEFKIFDKIDVADRWIFNKLELATRLGYECGPEAEIPLPGDYCVRPEMSLQGMGTGGFFKVHTDDWMQEPGYFWCEWFDGPQHWVQYINDVAVSYCTCVMNGDELECEQTRTNQAPALHPVLQNFSRYLLVEMIGDKIIEAAPRLMCNNAQKRFVADYKTIDPQYKPEDGGVDINYGQTNMMRQPVTLNGHDGYTWGDSDRVDYHRRKHDPTME